MGAYDLLYIKIGDEEVGARPTKWNSEDVTGHGVDEAGNEVQSIEWMTTCPNCGDMVVVDKLKIYVAVDDTEFSYQCPTCGAGKEQKKLQFPVGKPKEAPKEPQIAAFVDPISGGLFDVSINMELLAQLDEELKV